MGGSVRTRRGRLGRHGPPPGPLPLPAAWRAWVAGARPRTLPAAVVPVLVGTAAAAGEVPTWSAWRALAAGVVALALQVGTNYANDYSDGVRGTDDPGRRVGPGAPGGVGHASRPRP